jgi:hypothetical protein
MPFVNIVIPESVLLAIFQKRLELVREGIKEKAADKKM